MRNEVFRRLTKAIINHFFLDWLKIIDLFFNSNSVFLFLIGCYPD